MFLLGSLPSKDDLWASGSVAAGGSSADAPKCCLPTRPKRCRFENGTCPSSDDQSAQKCQEGYFRDANHTPIGTACAKVESSGVARISRKSRDGSGMVGVCWHKRRRCWMVYMFVKGKSVHGGYFRPEDDSPDEVEKARQLAIARRRALEGSEGRSGQVVRKIEECNPEPPHIGVAGVTWHKKKGCWKVAISVKAKNIHGGYFTPKDGSHEEVEKARQLAIARRRALEVSEGRRRRVFRTIEECNPEPRQSGMAGVRWHKQRRCWQVYMKVGRKNIHGGYFTPKDGSPEEVEKARQLAIARRRALEQQRK